MQKVFFQKKVIKKISMPTLPNIFIPVTPKHTIFIWPNQIFDLVEKFVTNTDSTAMFCCLFLYNQ